MRARAHTHTQTQTHMTCTLLSIFQISDWRWHREGRNI